MTVALVLVFTIAFLALLLWLLFWEPSRQDDVARSALDIKRLLPIHCRRFPQVRHVLEPDDEIFLCARVPKNAVRQWRAERNRVLRLYVHGLEQDFLHLRDLARLISALSPQLRRGQEWELLLLGLQFRFLYRLTLLRLMLRAAPFRELPRLTELVAELGLELERSLDRIAHSVPQVGMKAT